MLRIFPAAKKEVGLVAASGTLADPTWHCCRPVHPVLLASQLWFVSGLHVKSSVFGSSLVFFFFFLIERLPAHAVNIDYWGKANVSQSQAAK